MKVRWNSLVDSKINRMTYDNNDFAIHYANGSVLTVNKEYTHFSDKYGNECMYNVQGNILYQQNSPTYDELYEHWLKTKQND